MLIMWTFMRVRCYTRTFKVFPLPEKWQDQSARMDLEGSPPPINNTRPSEETFILKRSQVFPVSRGLEFNTESALMAQKLHFSLLCFVSIFIYKMYI